MPWQEFFIPLEPDDPRNDDRHDPAGESIRVRLNGVDLADYVVQYETPLDDGDEAGQSHAVVLRSDGSHAPDYDRYDVLGHKSTTLLAAHLTSKDVVNLAVDDIKAGWRAMRSDYFRGLQ